MQNNIAIPAQTSSAIKLLQLAVAVAGLWLLLHSWVVTRQQGEALLREQSTQLMRETLKTLSSTAAYLIENDQLDGLTQMTNDIATSAYLHDVVVYDSNGVRMSWSDGSAPARRLYAPSNDEALLPMVQEITREQQLLGYIKVSLRLDESVLPVAQGWQQLMHQVMAMLLLAGVVTFFLKRGFSRFSRQSFRLSKTSSGSSSNSV